MRPVTHSKARYMLKRKRTLHELLVDVVKGKLEGRSERNYTQIFDSIF